ncbi:MAG: hypothetical protein JRJ44_01525 [Deltaproteobacteria bacterium]|nr:hypothetical protein [Deltaproteobacteria bacterium]
MDNSIIIRDKFDFEVGYIIKSPCAKCLKKEETFPLCIDKCNLLDKIQTILAAGISCSKQN